VPGKAWPERAGRDAVGDIDLQFGGEERLQRNLQASTTVSREFLALAARLGTPIKTGQAHFD